MQREIKNKTVTFGIAALLLAVILTATVYNFGIQTNLPEKEGDLPPQAEEPTEPETPSVPNIPQEPSTQPSPSDSPSEPKVPEQTDSPPILSELKTFSNYEELKFFLNVGMDKAIQSENLARFNVGVDDRTFSADTVPAGTTEVAGGSEYSTTNVQVAGVDEADIVKSDSEYLYVISGQSIYILKAYPPDQAEVLSEIELDDTYDAQIYVNENRLVVLGSLSPYITYGFAEVTTEGLWINPSIYNEEVFLRVYDITNRADPVLSRTVTLNGTLSGSRMIGDYVYAVVRQLATQPSSNGTGVDAVLPMISGDFTKEVQPNEIRYVDTPDVYYYMTTILAVNVMNDAEEPTGETFLTGQTTTMYVSLNNMYLVVPNTNVWILSANGDEPRQETMIFRITLNEEKVVAMASGAVSGYVLNQFSMDEYNGFFRIATTTHNWLDGNHTNNLYVMNMSLNVVGSLEDLEDAQGETIYSARFMGNRCYIVTFKNIDPLFVIDLTDPTAPTVLGSLKVTGYSGYLHPYDENHIIGIGKETKASLREDFAWYQGVKISLFDVSDVSNPEEVAKYEIGDRGTDSPVLYDHKALLFDRERNLLVIPVLEAKIDPTDYPISLYPNGVPDSAYGDYVGQGAYVFYISPDGIELKGIITHIENGADLENNYWNYSDYFVERALYIEDVLYTVSGKLVKMNNLESLNLLKVIALS